MIRLALGLLALGLVSVPAAGGPAVNGMRAATELSAQAQRPRARLRVTPDRRRLLYRDCDFRLVQQWRPGGPAIVPWQRCWWVRG
jgi:hypothetical protein